MIAFAARFRPIVLNDMRWICDMIMLATFLMLIVHSSERPVIFGSGR
jgi:hypothetical protein